MPKDKHNDLLEAIAVMDFKPKTRSDGDTLKYLEALAERPVLLEEFDIPPLVFIHAARQWLGRRPYLHYRVKLEDGFCKLIRK